MHRCAAASRRPSRRPCARASARRSTSSSTRRTPSSSGASPASGSPPTRRPSGSLPTRPWKVAARVLRLDRSARSGQGRVFHYPRRGFGQIVEALADAAVDAGAELRLGTEVTEVDHRADGVVVRTADGATVEAGHAFSTVPLPLLARLALPGPPAQVLEDAARLRFRAMVLVYLVHEGGRWTAYDAHYFPGPETPVTRVSEPANYRVSADDPTDRTVLCAEIPCAVGDGVWTAADDELADARRGRAAGHRPAGRTSRCRGREAAAARLPGLRAGLRDAPRRAGPLGRVAAAA